MARHQPILLKRTIRLAKHASRLLPSCCTCGGSKAFGSNGQTSYRHENDRFDVAISSSAPPSPHFALEAFPWIYVLLYVIATNSFKGVTEGHFGFSRQRGARASRRLDVSCTHVYIMAATTSYGRINRCYLPTRMFPPLTVQSKDGRHFPRKNKDKK